jgi:hypothetical protein
LGKVWNDRWVAVKKDLTDFGLSEEQTKKVMFRIHNLIDETNGYHYENISYSSEKDLKELWDKIYYCIDCNRPIKPCDARVKIHMKEAKRNEAIQKTEYITIKEYPELIGKRAKFKNNLPGYCQRLWNKTGTIQQLFQVTKGDLDHVGLSLVFDEQVDWASGWEMDSCYIMPNSFELLR